MNKLNQGLAAIPLILMFAIMVIAIPLAINQSQKVITLQNKAANIYGQVGQECDIYQEKYCVDGLYCNMSISPHVCVRQGTSSPSSASVSCTDLESWKNQYCQNNPTPGPGYVSCTDINAMFNAYCRPAPTRTPPTQIPPTKAPTNIPTRAPLPTKFVLPTISACKTGEQKMVSAFKFVCDNGNWRYQQ